MRTALLFAIIFIATLRSWYFSSVGFSADNFVLAVLPIMFLLYGDVLRKVPRESLWIAGGVLVALAGGLLVTLVDQNDAIKLATPLSIGVYALCGVLVSSFACRSSWLSAIESALKYTIVIHAGFLFAQMAALLLFGRELDFQVMVTGEESRNVGGSLDNLGLGFFFRPSGLLNEPGTYAAWILPLVTLYMAMRSYRSDWAIVLGLLSVFFTFSSQGVVGATIITAVLLFRNRGWYSVIAAPVFGIVAFATLSFAIWERFILADVLVDASAVSRIASLQSAFTTYLGNGFLIPTIDIGDSTTVVYWWWYCGLFSIPLLAMFGGVAARHWRELALLFFLLFTSKVPATAPLYWLIIGLGLGFAVARRRSWQDALESAVIVDGSRSRIHLASR